MNKGKYSVMTFPVILITALFSSFFTVVGSILGDYEFRQYHGGFHYLLAICLPAIFVIILVIPAAAYRRLCRRSLVERLRT